MKTIDEDSIKEAAREAFYAKPTDERDPVSPYPWDSSEDIIWREAYYTESFKWK
jgi:hypothetical protein